MARFQGKVVIVTGSSSGIGRATAVLFAKQGANVTICGRKTDALKTTEQEMLSAGATASQILIEVGDITSDEVQKRIVENTVAKWEKLDVLINNAGAALSDSSGKRGFDMDIEVLRNMMELNMISVLKMINVASPHLKATLGEVVNVSTIAALNFSFTSSPYYAIAKAGLDQMSRSMATSLAEHGVRLNSVNPGLVRTNFLTNMGIPDTGSEKFYDYFETEKTSLPLGRVGTPEDIAGVIAFLANRTESGYILGQNIVADGGSSLMMTMGSHDMMKVLSS